MFSKSNGPAAKVPLHRRLYVQVVAAIVLGVVFLFQIAKKRCNRTASDLVTKAWMTSTANL